MTSSRGCPSVARGLWSWQLTLHEVDQGASTDALRRTGDEGPIRAWAPVKRHFPWSFRRSGRRLDLLVTEQRRRGRSALLGEVLSVL